MPGAPSPHDTLYLAVKRGSAYAYTRYGFSMSAKPPTHSAASANTSHGRVVGFSDKRPPCSRQTGRSQIHIRWCCIDRLRPPDFSGTPHQLVNSVDGLD